MTFLVFFLKLLISFVMISFGKNACDIVCATLRSTYSDFRQLLAIFMAVFVRVSDIDV